jgi:hypothetical protein
MGQRGGARAGGGRPQVVGSVRWQKAQRKAQRQPGAVQPAATRAPVAVAKPSDLPAGQSRVWDELAPHAISARTLVPSTVWAFRDLCEAIVLKRDMLALIESEGLTTSSLQTRMEQDGSGEQVMTPKAHPLLSRHAALMVRVEAGLTRFKLAPMGREMVEAQPAVVDEWAEFAAPLRAVK